MMLINCIILLVIPPVVKQPVTNLQGLWVDAEKGAIFYFNGNELTTVSLPFDHPTKGKFKLTDNSTLYFKLDRGYGHLNYKRKWERHQIQVSEDTLFFYYGIDTWDTLRLIKSNYKSYIDHYVNQDSIQIILPNTSFEVKRNTGEKWIEISIGFDKHHKEVIKFNGVIIETIHQFNTIIQEYKENEELWGNPLCMLFIDKNIKMGYVFDVQEVLKSNGVYKLLYVSQMYGKPNYETRFGGLKLMLRE